MKRDRRTGEDGQFESDEWVDMGIDLLTRLHQQIHRVLIGLRDARQPNAYAVNEKGMAVWSTG